MVQKGQKINDRYQIIKTIGEGGMANVYLAYDTILDRKVAVKILRGDLATDEKFVRRFQREALSASSLSHPNIVEVYDVGEDHGEYYIVMEYIEGRHLKQILKKRGHLTVPEVIDIMLQITDGIAEAHNSYIIHRDIKPQNIMVLDNGVVKITDFGIATALNSTQLTQTNSVMGTVHYLPPEQANGKGATIRSDVYSMGILMYELLCGKLPFRGDNAVEIALKHLKEPVPSIKEELPNLPQSIENVIIKATAKNPKNRYADAGEMHEDLKTVLDESRLNEPKYVYPYEEKEADDSKIMKMLDKNSDDKTKKQGEEIIAKQITEGDLKKQNKTLLTLGAIFTGLILITTAIIILLPKITEKPDITVPDVAGLTVVAAEKKLIAAGFEVYNETEQINSEEVEEGLVIKTSPVAGSIRKEGAKVKIYESLGVHKFKIENYVGQNYVAIKATLEVYEINVVMETEDVEDATLYDEGEIISQSVEEGTLLAAGDSITLTIPNILVKYPDFTEGSYTREDIQAFCE
ncbi:MAG TPA: Stk1 family PASTA domain-containing Ser/Thr kinase, partial [Bacilli bacterium]|nr:Stk1 family PASTA domain-containing Ser/Thr kinase [Bacilli bacterium]